jgi:hypothetical protein
MSRDPIARCPVCDTPTVDRIWTVMFWPEGPCFRCWQWALQMIRERS